MPQGAMYLFNAASVALSEKVIGYDDPMRVDFISEGHNNGIDVGQTGAGADDLPHHMLHGLHEGDLTQVIDRGRILDQ